MYHARRWIEREEGDAPTMRDCRQDTEHGHARQPSVLTGQGNLPIMGLKVS